jgi:hypothetical protein
MANKLIKAVRFRSLLRVKNGASLIKVVDSERRLSVLSGHSMQLLFPFST